MGARRHRQRAFDAIVGAADPLAKPDAVEAAQTTDDAEKRQPRQLDRSRAGRRDETFVVDADERERASNLDPDIVADQQRLEVHGGTAAFRSAMISSGIGRSSGLGASPAS